ncbi:hypothetical protein [Tropicibacter oceani]|uniref:Uncharacterized protein n=1 Tax=Tropicibacter oceani TaxID=3058420 RepID=A0ABY8QHY4_9RHOB|nr:hypothetical protein [Tropicibacter oceani]WGW03573.1 hypothetical protein QF118_16855 [Tropicibacter oceani]
MGQSWKESEYEITDAAYQDAVDRKQKGKLISRSEIVDQCRRGLPDRDSASIGPHLGNLTSARHELGLPVLEEVAPFANRPEKLVRFLKKKHRVQ